MLESQCLLEHQSFQLDHYAIPRLPPIQDEDYVKNGEMYQIEPVGAHLYNFLPPGTSILSLPFVKMANVLGVSTVNADQTFNLQGETIIESWLAAFLMAVLAAIFFYTARLVLPLIHSLLVTAGGALGTQVWSMTSRSMFSDTWAMLLLSLAIFLLLSYEVKGDRIHPVLMATILAWTYLVYPLYSVHVAAVTIYLLLAFNARQSIAYLLTGAFWAAGLVGYSWYNFGHLLPSYFSARRLFFRQFWVALPGHLISPSRGVLIFVPTIFFVAYLLIRFRKFLPHRRLVVTALAAISAHFVVITGIGQWWGGHNYGSRFTTGMIPWLVLLAILGLKAMLISEEKEPAPSFWRKRAAVSVGLVLLLASIWINGRGAISLATLEWNSRPLNVDKHVERVWDWRQPQFLAGLLPPPLPSDFPVIEAGTRIDFSNEVAEKYLWYGWSNAEHEFRWTNSNRAAIIFALTEVKPMTLNLKLGPFLVPGRLDQQTVVVRLNQEAIATLTLRNSDADVYSIKLPANVLRQRNVLEFEMPGAASPSAYNLNEDLRPLGIRVEYAQFLSD